jgi:hypothetical protein
VVAASADVSAPTAPANFAADAVQGGADLAWSASTDNVGVTGYRVIRDGAIVATTPGLAYADRNLAARSAHSYRVQAMDAAGNGALSPLRWITVPAAPDPGPGTDPGTDPGDGGSGGSGGGGSGGGDVTKPLVTFLSPKQRARLRGRALISARASDDTGVARIELYVDGRRVSAVRAAQLRRTWVLRGVKPGNHTLRVRAFDAGGNAASRSIGVRVLRPS